MAKKLERCLKHDEIQVYIIQKAQAQACAFFGFTEKTLMH